MGIKVDSAFSPASTIKRFFRVYCYGYRLGEVPLPPITETKGFKIKQFVVPDLTLRPAVQVSLGCHYDGASLPHPCPQDTDTMVAGVMKRIASKLPDPNKILLAELKEFTLQWCKQNLVPLSPDADDSFDTWLNKTTYPFHRKQELKEKWDAIPDMWKFPAKYTRCKSFQKDEVYPEYKHARGIFSREDEFKCRVGPIFKLIEEELYKHPSFIKHVPVKDRPNYIMEMLYAPGSKYAATDYTSFEASFKKEIMEACEFVMYEYMTAHLPAGANFIDLIRKVLTGKNTCVFKNFNLEIDATRMSGEMNTSLGNGFSNLMFMSFMCQKIGSTCLTGVVEGDDGLFRVKGRFPTKEEFAQLGMNIKLVVHENISTASFCGIVFDPQDRINVTNPMDELLTFGWTSRMYARVNSNKLKVLLRCKSLSMAHQYPGCPILSSLARYGLRMTRSFDVRHHIKEGSMSTWEREQLLYCLKHPIPSIQTGLATRQLVETLYGITVEEQFRIEEYLDHLEELVPLSLPEIEHHLSPVSKHYFSMYSSVENKDDPCLERPSLVWPELTKAWKVPWERSGLHPTVSSE